MEIFRPEPVRIMPFQMFTGNTLNEGIRDFGPTPVRVEEVKEAPVPVAAPKDSSVQDSVLTSPTENAVPPESPAQASAVSEPQNPVVPGWTRPPAVKLAETSSETLKANQ